MFGLVCFLTRPLLLCCRVLKPPGGGSSDIFGAAEAQQSPRKVKQYMASNITLTDGVAPPSGTGPGSTSSAASTTSSNETPPSPPTGSPIRNGTAPEQAQQVESQAQAQAQAQQTQAQAQETQAQAQEAQEAQGAEAQTPLEPEQVAAAGKAPDGEPRGRTFQMQSHFSLGYDKPATPVKGEAQGESVPVTETGTYPAQPNAARLHPPSCTLSPRTGAARRGATTRQPRPAGPRTAVSGVHFRSGNAALHCHSLTHSQDYVLVC